MEEKRPLIIITGPTASGKTALSIELAKQTGGEIISADSMQVYRHMDIGSARSVLRRWRGFPTIWWMCWSFRRVQCGEIPGHGRDAVEKICDKRHIPIVVGARDFTYRLSFMILILQSSSVMRLTAGS